MMLTHSSSSIAFATVHAQGKMKETHKQGMVTGDAPSAAELLATATQAMAQLQTVVGQLQQTVAAGEGSAVAPSAARQVPSPGDMTLMASIEREAQFETDNRRSIVNL
jgi:hypothetical protein